MTSSKFQMRLFHAFHLATRPMTLGVRVAAFDGERRIYLVRHTYVKGWLMPGGGVDAGETIYEAARRELLEEGNLTSGKDPVLQSFHFNRGASKRDHVAFFTWSDVTQETPKKPDREIAEAGFFPLDRLPEGTSAATRRRLDEITAGTKPDRYW